MSRPPLKTPKRQYATVVLQGRLVEPAQVIGSSTEWPKVVGLVQVQHGPDQQSLFYVTAVGPIGDRLLDYTVGRPLMVQGQLKASAGRLEVFITELTDPKAVTHGYMASMFMGRRLEEGEEWKEEKDEEDE